MKGHVRQRGDRSTWEYVIDVGKDPKTGKRRQRSKGGFTTRRAAQRAMREALTALDGGLYVDASKLTVAAYLAEHWLPSKEPRGAVTGRRHRGQVGVSTHSTYRTYIDAYVAPHIGAITLQDLTPAHVERLYDHLEREGGREGRVLSTKTLANVHGILHRALADAVRRGLLAANPIDRVEAPSPSKPRTNVWTVEELRGFLGYVAGERLYAMWLLFATTGMRRGEVLGLTWADLDLRGDEPSARIAWTLGVVDSRLTFKPRPKSDAAERVVSLDPATAESLRAWRARQAEERLYAGPAWRDVVADWRGSRREGLVFTWPDGSPLKPERVSKWFVDRCAAAGLPRIRLHDVRHTYASAGLAHATGWHEVKLISQRLGHASIGITLDTYAHALPAHDRETANTLARVILEGV